MILFESQIKDRYGDYANINAKVKSEVDAGRLFRLKKGVYAEGRDEHPYLCANALIRPSYVSFSTALSHYGLIPEAVFLLESATCLQGKSKRFDTALGRFEYRDVPAKAFPLGIVTSEEGYQIASPEKALADALFIAPPMRYLRGLKRLLFEDLRLDEARLLALDGEALISLLSHYRSANAKLMIRLWRSYRDGQ